jgi:hypothetical protein
MRISYEICGRPDQNKTLYYLSRKVNGFVERNKLLRMGIDKYYIEDKVGYMKFVEKHNKRKVKLAWFGQSSYYNAKPNLTGIEIETHDLNRIHVLYEKLMDEINLHLHFAHCKTLQATIHKLRSSYIIIIQRSK